MMRILMRGAAVRTTVTIDDDLLAAARRLTGEERPSELLRRALTTLVQVEAGRRLARLGGTMPDAYAGPRRRSDPA
jgi:Arc/MetJ family transcription regulator